MVCRSTISELFWQLSVLQTSQIAGFFSFAMGNSIEVKKAKGANFRNTECTLGNVLRHWTCVGSGLSFCMTTVCLRSSALGIISAVRTRLHEGQSQVLLGAYSTYSFMLYCIQWAHQVGSAMKKSLCHRFGWMVFQRVQCFDPNIKRTNRKTQTPSYL